MAKKSTKVAKKTTKKAKKKSAPKRTRKIGLNAKDIEHFKTLLLDKRRELLKNMNDLEGGALHKSRQDATGDLSSMPLHMADIGTDNFEQEFALGLLDSERKLLTKIDKALKRIEDGTYGICAGTNVPIKKARLEARPWASYSVEYQRKLEEGQI